MNEEYEIIDDINNQYITHIDMGEYINNLFIY